MCQERLEGLYAERLGAKMLFECPILQTAQQYDEFWRLLDGLPFDFSFSLLHEPGGHIALFRARIMCGC